MPLITQTPNAIVFSTAPGSNTLQGAINQAQSTQLPLFISAGVYTFPPATITAPVTITAIKDSVQLRSSTSNAFSISVGSGTNSSRVAGVVLRGLNFDGENKPLASSIPGLANFWNADRLVVEDCFFWQSAQSGVYLYGSEGRISSNRCDSCNESITGVNTQGMTLENNYLTNSLNNGIQFHVEPWGSNSFDGVVMHRNRIYTVNNNQGGSGQFGNAIVCTGLQFVRITDNIISIANYSAVRVAYCRDVVISGNVAQSIRETAIFVENPADYAGGWSNISVVSNVLNNVGLGISLVNCNAGSRRATVVGNTIYKAQKNSFPEWTTPDTNPISQYTRITQGVGIWGGADTIIEGNTVEQTASAAIVAIFGGTWNSQTQSAPDRNTVTTIVSGNNVKYCDVGVGYTDDDSRTFGEVSGNTIIGAVRAQIIKMYVTSLAGVPGIPNNGFGPPDIVSGAPDQGGVSSAVSNRWSFFRNKIVASTN